MNQRIRELALQAGHKPLGTFADELMDIYNKKFAELIVRECADVAVEQKQWVEDQKVFNPQDEHWNRARIQQSQHIADKIREHFGVEL